MASSLPVTKETLSAAIERIAPYVRAIGEFHGGEESEERPPLSGDHVLEYVCEGTAAYAIDGRIHSVAAGDAVLMPPRTPFRRLLAPGPLFIYRSIHFDFLWHGEGLQTSGWEWVPDPLQVQRPEPMRRAVGCTPYVSLLGLPLVSRMGHSPRFQSLVSLLFMELYRKEPGYQLALKVCMTAILLLLYREARGTGSQDASWVQPAVPAAVEHGKRYIESHYASHLSLASLAQEARYHPVYFERLFKKHVGCAPFEFLTHVRVEKAREFLLHSSLNITEIAAEVGFPSVQRFESAFHRLAGCTPREFRRAVPSDLPASAPVLQPSFPTNVFVGR